MTDQKTEDAVESAAPVDPVPVSKSEAAAAASAHSRINLALNLEAWRALPQTTQDALLWLHQHLLDTKMSWEDAAEALGYDKSTVFRVLKGTYEGSWGNIVAAIASYKRIATERASIQVQEFVENSLTALVFGALNYAMANCSITAIIGESRMGKTVSALAWRDRNNHGRSVYVVAPAYGGTRALLRNIASVVGVNKNMAAVQLHEAILRAFNRHRILIVDEAHRLLPGDRRTNPVGLEVLRDLHDQSGCALALLATQRFDSELRRGEYMYEQLLGRIGMASRLPRKVREKDIAPIIEQYIARPSAEVMGVALDIANKAGRLGILVETLKVASKIAGGGKARVSNEHFLKAVRVRQQMMGGDL